MNKEYPMPNPVKVPLSRNIILGLLMGVFVLVGYVALPVAESQDSAQRTPKPAVASAGQRLLDEDPINTYAAWLAEAHAHAAQHGQNAPLPSQF
jgi:hypothetical protein